MLKAKLNLDAGVLELDGTPDEIAAYVKAVVPAGQLVPIRVTVNGVACTCGTTQACVLHAASVQFVPFEYTDDSCSCGRSAAACPQHPMRFGATTGSAVPSFESAELGRVGSGG